MNFKNLIKTVALSVILFGCTNNSSPETIVPVDVNEDVTLNSITFNVSKSYKEFRQIQNSPYDSFKRFYFFDISITNNSEERIIVGSALQFNLSTYASTTASYDVPEIYTDLVVTGIQHLFIGSYPIEAHQNVVLTFIYYANFSITTKFIKATNKDVNKFVALNNIIEPRIEKNIALSSGLNIVGANIIVKHLESRDVVGEQDSGIWNNRTLNLVTITIKNTLITDFLTTDLDFSYYQINGTTRTDTRSGVSEESLLIREEGIGIVLDHYGNVVDNRLASNKTISPGEEKEFILAFVCSQLQLGSTDNVFVVKTDATYEYANMALGTVAF
jgi:hypothetical protein